MSSSIYDQIPVSDKVPPIDYVFNLDEVFKNLALNFYTLSGVSYLLFGILFGFAALGWLVKIYRQE